MARIHCSTYEEVSRCGVVCADTRFRNNSFAQIRRQLAQTSVGPAMGSRRLSDREGSPRSEDDCDLATNGGNLSPDRCATSMCMDSPDAARAFAEQLNSCLLYTSPSPRD